MRVRINFTIEVDPEQYREVYDCELDKQAIRGEIQEQAISDTVLRLVDEGVTTRMVGRNNTYDSRQRLTRAEHLVT